MNDRLYQKSSAKFPDGDFLLNDILRSSGLVNVNHDQIKILLENNQHCMTQKVTRVHTISESIDENH